MSALERLEMLPDTVGLIAGTGGFPVLIARAAKAHGMRLIAFCISDHRNDDLEPLCDEFHSIKLSKISSMIELAHRSGVTHMVLAGRIPHEVLLNPMLLFDARVRSILSSLTNRKADTVLGAITQELEGEGFTVLDSTLFVESAMPKPGLLTPAAPPLPSIMDDIDFGWQNAKAIAALDIGQTVAVKQGVVVAVEALEGTDRLIQRAGELAGEGVVFVKVSKPRQNMKFDVPIIGLTTVENLVRVKAAAIAISARQSLFFDQQAALELAARHRITIYSYDEQATPPPQ